MQSLFLIFTCEFKDIFWLLLHICEMYPTDNVFCAKKRSNVLCAIIWKVVAWRWWDDTPFSPSFSLVQNGFILFVKISKATCAVDKEFNHSLKSMQALSTFIPCDDECEYHYWWWCIQCDTNYTLNFNVYIILLLMQFMHTASHTVKETTCKPFFRHKSKGWF